MKTIEIKKENLVVFDELDVMLTINSENGSGLYYGTNEEGEEICKTRDELKKLSDINAIDETLELLSYMEYGMVYTEDMMNFIDESEYNRLKEEYPEVEEDYEKVEFVVA